MSDTTALDPTTLDLDTTLQKLRLQTFVRNHASFADDALQGHHTYQKYLFDLASHELDQRERNRHAQRIRAARFPVIRELADFDFSAVPSLQKQVVFELARGGGHRHHLAVAALCSPYRRHRC